MRRMTWLFLMCVVIFLLSRGGFAGQDTAPAVEGQGISDEELEIIASLDLLDSMELLGEDLSFLEDYEGVEQPETTGEDQ